VSKAFIFVPKIAFGSILMRKTKTVFE